MTRYLRILLLATAVLALGAGPATAAPYQDARQPVSKRVSDLLSRMTLQEKIGQMTQTERLRVDKDASADHHAQSRLDPLGWRVHAGGEHAEGVGRHGRPLPEGGARHAPEDPADLRRRLRARPRQPARRDGVPAQHRHGRDTRSRPRAQGRPHHGVRDARERPAVDVRAVHLRRARRSLGPHVRELQRGRRAGQPDGDRDRRLPGLARPARRPRPRARHGQALRGRRRHAVRHRGRRLHGRPGHREAPATRTSGRRRCGSTSPPSRSTMSAA